GHGAALIEPGGHERCFRNGVKGGRHVLLHDRIRLDRRHGRGGRIGRASVHGRDDRPGRLHWVPGTFRCELGARDLSTSPRTHEQRRRIDMGVFARKSAQGGPRPDEIRTVTSDTFTSLVIQGEGPIVVEFMSYGCAHCRVMEPILQEVAEMVKPQETIFRVNIAVERELADSYEIEGTPTLLMFLE